MALSKEEAEKYLEKPKKVEVEVEHEPKKGEMVSAHRLRLFSKLMNRGYSPDEMSDVDRLKCFDELIATKE